MAKRRRRPRWVRTHQFHPGDVRDWRGDPYCTCGKPKGNRAHNVPPLDPHTRHITARIVGEHMEPEEK